MVQARILQIRKKIDPKQFLWRHQRRKSKAWFCEIARSLRTANERFEQNHNAAIAVLVASQTKKSRGLAPAYLVLLYY